MITHVDEPLCPEPPQAGAEAPASPSLPYPEPSEAVCPLKDQLPPEVFSPLLIAPLATFKLNPGGKGLSLRSHGFLQEFVQVLARGWSKAGVAESGCDVCCL